MKNTQLKSDEKYNEDEDEDIGAIKKEIWVSIVFQVIKKY